MRKIALILCWGLITSAFAQTNTFPASGSVGIGTMNPVAVLQIINTPEDANGNTLILGPTNGANLRLGYNIDYSWIQSHGGEPLYINQLGNNIVLNLIGGNVGIGTTNPTEKLSVNGNIRSQKLIVTQTGWSDYVFDSSYQLKPLTEIEQFIKDNKHLPDVPSATEVAKDGIDVGENQVLLLKKIEELTLYMIEMKKDNAAMKKEIEALQKENAQQKIAIQQLQSK